MHTLPFALLTLVAAGAAAQSDAEWPALLQRPTFDLVEALTKGRAAAGSGTPFKVELELDKDKLVYSIDIAQGTKTCALVLDVSDGRTLDREIDADDRSKVTAACKVALGDAIASALRHTPGKALLAEMSLRDGRPSIDVIVFASKATVVSVDGVSGAVLTPAGAAAPTGDALFTDTFVLDQDELVATGTNPFFNLVPGHTLVLEGKDGAEVVQLTITVLDATRKVAGVETRVVEERETKGGRLVEVSRNFFAISKKTNSVYYFGEEVDIYQDGKVASHDGAWVAGAADARFGLMLPGTVLLGSRYYQEVAPDVAMDRAEVVSLTGTLDTPAGRFADVLVIEESTPLEKGKERKHYARGVGFIGDADLRLVRRQDPAKK